MELNVNQLVPNEITGAFSSSQIKYAGQVDYQIDETVNINIPMAKRVQVLLSVHL